MAALPFQTHPFFCGIRALLKQTFKNVIFPKGKPGALKAGKLLLWLFLLKSYTSCKSSLDLITCFTHLPHWLSFSDKKCQQSQQQPHLFRHGFMFLVHGLSSKLTFGQFQHFCMMIEEFAS